MRTYKLVLTSPCQVKSMMVIGWVKYRVVGGMSKGDGLRVGMEICAEVNLRRIAQVGGMFRC